jgi:hypothetical protein
MKEKEKTTRRMFLKGALVGAGGLAAYVLGRGLGLGHVTAQDPNLTPHTYLPYIRRDGLEPRITPTATPTGTNGPVPSPTKTTEPEASPTPTSTPTSGPSPTSTSTPSPSPSPTFTPSPAPTPSGRPRVAHVHDTGATSWDFSSGWYGDYVDQTTVNQMVAHGLMTLTGTGSVSEAWQVLLPGYQAGQKIAIKVNFNNASCDDSDNRIDALIEPINGLIRTLTTAGVQEADVWVYEGSRNMPGRFYNRRQYTQALYIDYDRYGETCADAEATYDESDPSLRVTFSPAALTDRWLPDLLYQATYVINMPILKAHGIHPVSLGFKNHFGSLNVIIRGGDDDLHPYIAPLDDIYSPNYSPLVDIYSNSNLADKTILTIGDGLFGAPGATQSPIRWSTFGNVAPNSLFFSRDPVAVDCVMSDLLDAEWQLDDEAYDYLQLAQGAGLGTFERGDPWGGGYSAIDYIYAPL